MIERIQGTFTINCDFCSEFDESQEDEWSEAVREWKNKGWKMFKHEDEWEHKCPDCFEKWKRGGL